MPDLARATKPRCLASAGIEKQSALQLLPLSSHSPACRCDDRDWTELLLNWNNSSPQSPKQQACSNRSKGFSEAASKLASLSRRWSHNAIYSSSALARLGRFSPLTLIPGTPKLNRGLTRSVLWLPYGHLATAYNAESSRDARLKLPKVKQTAFKRAVSRSLRASALWNEC